MFFFFFFFFFLSNVRTAVDCTGFLGNFKILSLALLKSKVNSAIQYLQLFFLKSQTDELIISPTANEHKTTPKYGEKQPPFVCKQTRGFILLAVCQVIILAGIIIYIIILFLSLISICHLSITSNIKKINKRKLNREKIDCQSSFGVKQGSVICTVMYIPVVIFK